MDNELFVALLALWLTTTTAMISFLSMWFFNGGEAFHPHSVDIDQRHKLYLVVSSSTECKFEFAIKSISSFAAPRGSSSSAYFTSVTIMTAVSGILGTSRWFFVGDANLLEATLSFLGFGSLFLVAAFEMDVSPERFLEDKLLVTIWLIKRLKLQNCFTFNLSPYSEEFKEFIRESKDIYYLYEEDVYLRKKHETNIYENVYIHLHILGAIGYCVLTTASILVNDTAEVKVAWITGIFFCIFGFIGYLTGSYLPVLPAFRCWILVWNPFIREPQFMLKLIKAVKAHCDRYYQNEKIDQSNENGKSLRKRKGNTARKVFLNPNIESILSISTSDEADKALDIFPLKFARHHPKLYIKYIGIILVMSELVALMTPAVAMGIQWVTALCHGPPVLVIIELLKLCFHCMFRGDCKFLSDNSELHCILKDS